MTTDIQPAEQPQAEERRSHGWFWLALLVMAAICLVAAYRSALFRFERAEISGLERLTEAEVLQIAGLAPGAPRWQHFASALQKRLLAEPWIRTADVRWEWSTVRIELTEREPVGLIRYSDRFYLTLDREAVILAQSELMVGQALPVISGKEVQAALRGRTVGDPGVRDALSVLAPMLPALRSQISEVRVGDDRSLTFYMTAGATVLWGQAPIEGDRAAATAEKIQWFAGLWNRLGNRSKTCQIDVRVEGNYSAGGCN